MSIGIVIIIVAAIGGVATVVRAGAVTAAPTTTAMTSHRPTLTGSPSTPIRDMRVEIRPRCLQAYIVDGARRRADIHNGSRAAAGYTYGAAGRGYGESPAICARWGGCRRKREIRVLLGGRR